MKLSPVFLCLLFTLIITYTFAAGLRSETHIGGSQKLKSTGKWYCVVKHNPGKWNPWQRSYSGEDDIILMKAFSLETALYALQAQAMDRSYTNRAIIPMDGKMHTVNGVRLKAGDPHAVNEQVKALVEETKKKRPHYYKYISPPFWQGWNNIHSMRRRCAIESAPTCKEGRWLNRGGYWDNYNNRAFRYGPKTKGDSKKFFTPVMCQKLCSNWKGQFHKYFALQDHMCSCENDWDHATKYKIADLGNFKGPKFDRRAYDEHQMLRRQFQNCGYSGTGFGKGTDGCNYIYETLPNGDNCDKEIDPKRQEAHQKKIEADRVAELEKKKKEEADKLAKKKEEHAEKTETRRAEEAAKRAAAKAEEEKTKEEDAKSKAEEATKREESLKKVEEEKKEKDRQEAHQKKIEADRVAKLDSPDNFKCNKGKRFVKDAPYHQWSGKTSKGGEHGRVLCRLHWGNGAKAPNGWWYQYYSNGHFNCAKFTKPITLPESIWENTHGRPEEVCIPDGNSEIQTKEEETKVKNTVEENAHRVGGWGGKCTCPNGEIYYVGDNYNSCGSLACVNGKSGRCHRHHGKWSRRKVTMDVDSDLDEEDDNPQATEAEAAEMLRSLGWRK
eukprot:g4138.t1